MVSQNPVDRRFSSLAGWAGPIVLSATGLAMLAWTWGTWPDVVIDFGRELYVPWQLAEGKVLYRDIAWFNGPLSAHWNAALFSLFGVGLQTLVFANLALVGLQVWLLYALIARVAGRELIMRGLAVVVLAMLSLKSVVGLQFV